MQREDERDGAGRRLNDIYDKPLQDHYMCGWWGWGSGKYVESISPYIGTQHAHT